MASYHLSVKTVQRSAGRSATAAIAYRTASRVVCEREGRTHDYRAKTGVETTLLLVPQDAPEWAHDRQALWNAAEARETRSNSVTAREWELALPSELDAEGRRLLVQGFAAELVARYGVAADVAIHAPHREGDGRNWHAHVLTTTRSLTAEGLTDKTRVLDAKGIGGPEIEHMRGRWAELQNHALKRLGHEARVDHRSLAVQREEARSLGHEARADNLDRAPEVKLGPVVSGIERREQRAADREEREYVPLTERGAQVHEARAARSLLAELGRVRDALREEVRQRAELARETYTHAREQGADRVRAGLAALRAAAERQGIGEARGHGLPQGAGHGREHLDHALDRALGRGQDHEGGQDPRREREVREASRASIRERLGQIIDREATHHAQEGPLAGLPTNGLDQQGQERSLGAEAIRERLEALRDRAQPGTQSEELATGLPASGQERTQDQEAHRGRSAEAIREQLRGVLDRAKPVTVEREGMDQEREGRTHTERAHGEEREEHALKPRERGISYGL